MSDWDGNFICIVSENSEKWHDDFTSELRKIDLIFGIIVVPVEDEPGGGPGAWVVEIGSAGLDFTEIHLEENSVVGDVFDGENCLEPIFNRLTRWCFEHIDVK